MPIIDSKKALNYIAKWMSDYLSSAGKSGLNIYHHADEYIEYHLLKYICKTYRIPYVSMRIIDNYEYMSLIAYCKENNYLSVSSLNRDKYRLIRDYPKFFNPDLAPLTDMFRSETCTLLTEFQSLNVNEILDLEHPIGTSWRLLEWIDREDSKNNIITSSNDPVTNPNWALYSATQKKLLAKINQIEKLTRHKQNPNLPTILRRNLPGLMP